MSEMVCPRSLRIGRGEPLSSPSAEQVTPPLAEEMLLLLPPLVIWSAEVWRTLEEPTGGGGEVDPVLPSITDSNLGESLALPKGGGEGDISGRGETGVGDAGGLYSPGGEDSSPPTTAPSLISGLE